MRVCACGAPLRSHEQSCDHCCTRKALYTRQVKRGEVASLATTNAGVIAKNAASTPPCDHSVMVEDLLRDLEERAEALDRLTKRAEQIRDGSPVVPYLRRVSARRVA